MNAVCIYYFSKLDLFFELKFFFAVKGKFKKVFEYKICS